MSTRASQTRSSGAATWNECSSLIATGPPARSASSWAGVSTSSPPPRSSQGISREPTLSRRLRAPWSPRHVAQPREQRALEEHGMSGPAAVGGAHRLGAVTAGGDHAADRVGRQPRLVAERDHHRLAVRERTQAGGERGRLALLPARGTRAARRRRGSLRRARPRHPRPAPRPLGPTGAAVIARSAYSSNGRPSSSASCFAAPKRLARPAARTIPPITRPCPPPLGAAFPAESDPKHRRERARECRPAPRATPASFRPGSCPRAAAPPACLA